MHTKNLIRCVAVWLWCSFLLCDHNNVLSSPARAQQGARQLIASESTAHTSDILATDKDAIDILEVNRIACGGDAWNEKATLESMFDYAGQGMTGTEIFLIDLKMGSFVDSYDIGPTKGASGWDGVTAWKKDISGTITPEGGGDKRALAINQAYRNANIWWRKDRGGAAIVSAGIKKDRERECTVLRVAPRNGKDFEAWFDNKSHVLARIVEVEGYFQITTNFSDYRPVDGALLAHKVIVDLGAGPAGLQTLTLKRANFRENLPNSAFAPPTVAPSDFSIANGLHETTLPFRLRNNHIFADVKVNGRGPFNFIFDTGGHDILFPATAHAIGLKVEGVAPSGGAGDKVAEFGYSKIDTLEVADAKLLRQVVSVIATEPSEVEGFAIDGMIGFEVFRRFVTRFDFGARTITLIDPGKFDPRSAGRPVAFDFYDHIPQVRGRFEENAARFSIDTGSRGEVDLNKPFVDREGLIAKHPRNVLAIDGWGVGGETHSYVTRSASVHLGDVEIPNVIADFSTSTKGSFSDANTDGYIGSGLLKRFVVTFDYDNRMMYLKALPKPVSDTATYDRSGMWINAGANGFEIVGITSGSPAEQAKLTVGDHIVAVEGNPVKPEQLSDFRMRLRDDPAGTVVHLTVKSQTGQREVALTLRDQI
jgi:hypothetical protein